MNKTLENALTASNMKITPQAEQLIKQHIENFIESITETSLDLDRHSPSYAVTPKKGKKVTANNVELITNSYNLSKKVHTNTKQKTLKQIRQNQNILSTTTITGCDVYE